MENLVLSESQQRALRCLLAVEPVPGTPLPQRRTLEHLAALVRCDGVSVAVADTRGHLLDSVGLARSHWGCGVPVTVGLRWASTDPQRRHQLLGDGVVDSLLLGCRNGRSDLVVQLALERWATAFASRDVALLHLIEPALARLFRERPAPHLPEHLTTQERRILELVAAGKSNSEVAGRMGIATSTVRKHLEHAFPKLGVTNRHAAAIAFGGGTLPGPDGARQVESFA